MENSAPIDRGRGAEKAGTKNVPANSFGFAPRGPRQ